MLSQDSTLASSDVGNVQEKDMKEDHICTILANRETRISLSRRPCQEEGESDSVPYLTPSGKSAGGGWPMFLVPMLVPFRTSKQGKVNVKIAGPDPRYGLTCLWADLLNRDATVNPRDAGKLGNDCSIRVYYYCIYTFYKLNYVKLRVHTPSLLYPNWTRLLTLIYGSHPKCSIS